MTPGRLVTCVVRVSPDGPGPSPPTTPLGLRALTRPPFLDEAAEILATGSLDVVGYASTTSAYAIGFDAEAAMVSRLSALLAVPVAATCASAVRALQVLGMERVALIGAPWFEAELNALGTAYFRGQGFDVVSSESAGLPRDPDRIDPGRPRMDVAARGGRRTSSLHRRERLPGGGSSRPAGGGARPPCAHSESGPALEPSRQCRCHVHGRRLWPVVRASCSWVQRSHE